VAVIAAALLQAEHPVVDVNLVMDDRDSGNGDLVERAQRRDRTTGQVHERHRLGQHHSLTVDSGDADTAFQNLRAGCVRLECTAHSAREEIGDEEPDVMPVPGVLRTGISEPGDQPGGARLVVVHRGPPMAMPAGATVTVHQCSAGWCQVSYAGRTGWASQRYIDVRVAAAPQTRVAGPRVGFELHAGVAPRHKWQGWPRAFLATRPLVVTGPGPVGGAGLIRSLTGGR
jgi:hypothetical protein